MKVVVAFVTALMIAAPAVAAACSYGTFSGNQPGFYFTFSALADTVEAGWPARSDTWTHLQPSERQGARFGQMIELDRVAGIEARLLPAGTERLLVVPWTYDAQCRTLPWKDSARWLGVGESGYMDAVLRPRTEWAGGVPTADMYLTSNLPYPQRDRHAARQQAAMTYDQVFDFLGVLPAAQGGSAASGSVDALMAWARQHPDLAALYPASQIVTVSLNRIASERIRGIAPPFAGTYRFELDLGDGETRTFFARTESHATTPFGREEGNRWIEELRPPTIAGYSLLTAVAPTAELLPQSRSGAAQAYLYGIIGPDAPGAAIQVIPGAAEFSVVARAFPDDTLINRLNRTIRANLSAFIDRNLPPAADAEFRVHADGRVTFRQTYQLGDGVTAILRGERISLVTMPAPR